MQPCGWTTRRLDSCYLPSVDRTAEANRLARIYVWWQDPETTLTDPRALLCQILKLGRPEDYVAAERLWGTEVLRQALIEARPGEIDPKSEHFWRLHFGLVPAATSARS